MSSYKSFASPCLLAMHGNWQSLVRVYKVVLYYKLLSYKHCSSDMQDYQEATHLEQFVTRFLLKETTSQLQSLQSSLECAMETTAEQTRQERQDFWVTLTLLLNVQQPQHTSMHKFIVWCKVLYDTRQAI